MTRALPLPTARRYIHPRSAVRLADLLGPRPVQGEALNDASIIGASRSAPEADFLTGGEMGPMMRAHDWTTSPLGPPETWPHAFSSWKTR